MYIMVFNCTQYRDLPRSYAESTFCSQDDALEEVIWEAIESREDELGKN